MRKPAANAFSQRFVPRIRPKKHIIYVKRVLKKAHLVMQMEYNLPVREARDEDIRIGESNGGSYLDLGRR